MLDIFKTTDCVYIVSEFVRYGNLRDLLKRFRGSISTNDVLTLIYLIIEAVDNITHKYKL